MDILIVGGTLFLGRHLVDAATAAGHRVTLFNRGRTNPELYPDVEKLRGDRREGEYGALAERRWDAAIDTCGYLPAEVRSLGVALGSEVDHYTFVSTLSVFADQSVPNDELSPVGSLDEAESAELTNETYGPLKAACERVAEDAFPGRTLTVRPGLIVGPFDPTDRYGYWPHRLARGGEVLAPRPTDQPVQIIDGRDLAEWTVRMVEAGRTGVYNATSPAVTFEAMVDGCRRAAERMGAPPAEITWVDPAWLLERKVSPWSELPVWLPAGGQFDGLHRTVVDRAVEAGLTRRPLDVVAADFLAWDRSRPADGTWQHTLSSEREVELLDQWRSSGED